ncbi:unnamed protein product [Cylicostephanus goldi]|uniref:Uncharacterized protein n=1 Tax=Cylicostephanus goldi TaxID=71465 RepID=A0A3P6SEI3_CYLGO|nr:unnamed protein product [Cylicostephanus goldi]
MAAILKPVTQEQMYGHHRASTIGSVAKGEARTARSSVVVTDIAVPKLRDPTNQKIPYALRVMFLKRIFDQYLEVCPRVEAIRNVSVDIIFFRFILEFHLNILRFCGALFCPPFCGVTFFKNVFLLKHDHANRVTTNTYCTAFPFFYS